MLKTRKTVLVSILCALTALCVFLGTIGINNSITTFATTETHNHVNYTAWGGIDEEKDSLPTNSGSYYLTDDIFLFDTWTVPNGTVNLCLNGHNVIMREDSNVISVSNGATLNIYECDETEQNVFGVVTNGGKISCLNKTKRNIVVKGTFNMYGGTVFGGKTGIYLSDGTFNMYGGYITANSYSSEETDTYGGGVLIDGGSFTMNGGKIYGNRSVAQGQETTLYSYGAGVFVDGEGSFTMNGGEIYGNESEYGSGIYLKDGTFNMTGGEIHDNGSETGDSFGSGLYVSENGTASLTGGKIYNNTASDKNGGAGVCCKGKLSLGGTVQIVNNTHDYEDGGKSNISFHNSGENYINLISPKDGMLVGISMPSSGGHFTDIEEEQGNEKYFFADREDEYVVYNGWIGLRHIKGSYRDYKIDIGTSEHGVVYSNYQGSEKALIEDGITVYLTTVPEKGYGLKSLKVKFDNGEEYDITKEKSFVMIEENATVTAEFDVASFKAVFDETDSDNKTLTFYFDAVDYSGENITVYDNLTTNATKVGDWAYHGIRESVKAVIFDKSIENFHGLTSTNAMLYNMRNAEDIKGAEYLDVSNVTSMNNMFGNYGHDSTKLTVVPSVENWNTSSVKNMNNMFFYYGYSSTELTVVPSVANWNTSSVTTMRSMFSYYGYNSTKLTAVPSVANWNTSNVTTMMSMFSHYGCKSPVLNAVPSVANWNTSSVTEMIGMFQGYGQYSTELTVVPTVENWNTSSVTNMSDMFQFYGQSSRKLNFTLDLSGWNLSNVNDIDDMFMGAGQFSSNWEVKIPSSSSGKTNTQTTWYVGDGTQFISPAENRKFTVNSFKAVFDENGEKNTLTFYFDAVEYSGENITVYDNLTTNATKVGDWSYNGIRASVKAVIFDKSIENFHGLTSTKNMLFNMTNAEDIKGAEYLDVSNVTSMNNMFMDYGYDSTKLTAVPSVANWNTSSVTNMYGLFRGYGYSSTELTAVPSVENWDTSSVTNMRCMFQSYGQSSRKLNFTLDLTGWNLSNVNDVDDMFRETGRFASNWEVKIPSSSSGKTNTEDKWYVGDGTEYIEPASGRTFTVKDYDPSFKGYSLMLSSDISINFYMNLNEEQALNGSMKFTIGNREITATVSESANGYYFRCPLNSLEIATKVKAVFTFDGKEFEKEYSVLDYVRTVVDAEKGRFDEKLVDLCKKISNYGYYSQLELARLHDDVTIGNGGYAGMTHYEEPNVEGAKTGLSGYAFVNEHNNENIVGVARSLSLDDKIAMNFYIQVKDGYVLTENMITVSGGKLFTLTLVSENYYRITVRNIEAANFGTDYTVTVDGEVIKTSVLSYANKIVNGEYDPITVNAMTALYEYYVSAMDYRTK